MSESDITRPATEVEIAEAIDATKGCKFDVTIRRLAFERDRLLADAKRWRHWMIKMHDFGLPVDRIQANTDSEIEQEM